MRKKVTEYKGIGSAILKSGFRIACLLFLSLVGIFFLLYVGLIIHYCCTGNLGNRIASLKDLCEYVLTSNTKLENWAFSPENFDFEQTNQVYVAEFCPLRARKHSVYFLHKNAETLDSKRIEQLVNGVVLKIAVYHAQTGDLYEEVARMGFSTSEHKATPIYKFSTADLPWKYTDKLRIEIVPLALNLRMNESESELNKTELHVTESLPFY